jgi:hypothetical protein
MNLKSPILLIALFQLQLGGCSYGYTLKVIERNGSIAFVAEDKHGTECLANFTVRNSNGEIMWDLYADNYTPPPCQSRLPIIYGVVPNGMKVRTNVKPLVANTNYIVDAWDGDSYRGAFRFKPGIVIDNIDYKRAATAASRVGVRPTK